MTELAVVWIAFLLALWLTACGTPQERAERWRDHVAAKFERQRERQERQMRRDLGIQ